MDDDAVAEQSFLFSTAHLHGERPKCSNLLPKLAKN